MQTKMVERVINDGLIAMVPKFDMAKFLKMLPCDFTFGYKTDYHSLKLILIFQQAQGRDSRGCV